jgi:hypothetical protein
LVFHRTKWIVKLLFNCSVVRSCLGFDLPIGWAFTQAEIASLRSQGISPVKSLDFFRKDLFRSALMGMQKKFYPFFGGG